MVDAAELLARAWLLHQQGNREAAISEMRQAIAAGATEGRVHNDLGVMLRAAGRIDEAIASFENAIRLDPTFWQARYNLGNALQRQARHELALDCYAQVLSQVADDADVHLNAGVSQMALGRFDAARASFQRALEIRPEYADPWINLGLLAKNEGDFSQAVRCYRHALKLNPDSAAAHYNLGMVWRALDHVDAAVESFREAIRINPQHASAQRQLADALAAQGSFRDAIEAYDAALRIQPDDALRIRRALCMPLVLESPEQIAERRSQLAADLDALASRPLTVQDPPREIGQPCFPLAYQGFNERETQARISSILTRATPELTYVAPHCSRREGTAADLKIKIGFVSMHFRAHTIGKLNLGLIERLDRQRFDVTVFRGPDCTDAMAERIAAAADASFTLPTSLAAAQSLVAARELDVLFYTDIGLDWLTYYLAHARLARVQCVTWGHPLTTGIPAIDYFVSSEDLDVAHAEEHYSESLARLSSPAVYYYRPQPTTSTRTRADFGLSDASHVYACLQSPFKLHPDDDLVLAQILRRDPLGVLVLLEGLTPHWSALLRERFARAISEVAERIVFVPQQPPPDFSRLLALCNVLLDPIHFSGGDTSYQSFAVGTPIVTLPGEFLRSRITYALYRAMDMDECVARSRDDFVERAVRLGTDADWRGHVSAQILARNHAIYENASGVRALEDFLIRAVTQ